jgi:multidrug efflux pump subunit AcrA (membrane-fusion protein)
MAFGLFLYGTMVLATPTVSVEIIQNIPQVVVAGTTIPYQETQVAAQFSGTVTFLAGEAGEAVKQGAVLAVLSDDALQARRASALAAMQQAQVVFNNALIQYQREILNPTINNINRSQGLGAPSLFDQFFTRQIASSLGISNPAVDRFSDLFAQSSAVEEARSAFNNARAVVAEIEAQLADTRSLAPYDGVILHKLVEVGDSIQAGQPLLVLADLRYLRVQVEMPVALLADLKVGDFLETRVEVNGGLMVKGRVSQIFPSADPKRRTVRVKLDLPQGFPGIPGLYAEVRLADKRIPRITEAPQLAIPKSAVLQQGSLPSVYVEVDKGKFALRVVRLGETLADGKVLVLSGLKAGDRLAADPVLQFKQQGAASHAP